MSLERQYKIAFIGTSCVGKTTLFEALNKIFPKACFVPEAAREFFATNTVEDRFSAKTQGKIQEIALKNEQLAHEGKARIIFCDRSVLDAVVYTREHGDIKGSEELFKRIKYWLSTYNLLLLLNPTDIFYKPDEIRTESIEKRNSFHHAFLRFFQNKSIPYYLLSGTLEERIQKITHIIEYSL